jgi:hypothetical protein
MKVNCLGLTRVLMKAATRETNLERKKAVTRERSTVATMDPSLGSTMAAMTASC